LLAELGRQQVRALYPAGDLPFQTRHSIKSMRSPEAALDEVR